MSQLALESSFLGLPAARDIAGVVYGGHHELPYIYLDVGELPRGEYATPRRVVEILGELVHESVERGQPVVTPITVSYCHEPYQARPELFIIDGNNRATAILLMKYISFVGFAREGFLDQGNLRRFIALYDLDMEWERDLVLALRSLASDGVDCLLANQSTVKEFAGALAPVLLVQEPNFHTVSVARSFGKGIVLLQPMHQVVYNQQRLPMAIPSKQQSHGRAAGNDLRINLKDGAGR